MTQTHCAATPEAVEALLDQGLYCAESVLLTIAQQQGIHSSLLPGIASGLCGGMAGTCGTCGALTGAVLGIGLVLGRPGPGISLGPVYAATHQLVREFEQTFGAKHCHELLGCDIGTPEGKAQFRARDLSRQCRQYSAQAAAMAIKAINAGAAHQP